MHLVPLVLVILIIDAVSAKCPEDSIGYPGNDIGAKKTGVATWQKCGELCSSTAGCLFFTYTAKKKSCSLKSSGVSRKVAKNKVSGPRGCPAPKVPKPAPTPKPKPAPVAKPTPPPASGKCPDNGIGYPGNDIGAKKDGVATWQECGKLCSSTAGCLFFTYTPSKKICSLKSSGESRKFAANKISGARGCPVVVPKPAPTSAPVPKPAPTSAPVKPLYTSMGCWRDTSVRAIEGIEGKDARLDGSYQTRANAIKKCYQAAKQRGFAYFALQNGGWCATSANAGSRYKMYGTSTACRDGKGGGYGNDVYMINVATPTAPPASGKCPDNGIGYPGNDIGAKKNGVATWQKCGKLCSSTAGCQFFTYTPSKKKCSLKSSGVSRKLAANKISGARGCPAVVVPTSACVKTVGGNGGGGCCTFPFTYRGKVYNKCTKLGHNQVWCATVKDKVGNVAKWGNCVTAPKPTALAPVYANYKDKQCKATIFRPKGCYNSNKYLVRGKMLLYWRYDIEWAKDRMPHFAHSFVCACAEVAKAAGVKHFGTHFWGECFALKMSQITVAPKGDCTLADGKYKTKCTNSKRIYTHECLGIKSYYVYNVV